MPRSLSSPKFNLKMSGSLVNTLTDESEVTVSQPSLNYAPTLTSGVSANQANRVWQEKDRTLASGQQVTIDVYDFGGAKWV